MLSLAVHLKFSFQYQTTRRDNGLTVLYPVKRTEYMWPLHGSFNALYQHLRTEYVAGLCVITVNGLT
jgi:hypothetical protein